MSETPRRSTGGPPGGGPGNVVVLPVARRAQDAPTAVRPSLRSRALAPIDPPLAFVVFLAAVLLIGGGRALEPAAVDLHAGVPLWLLAIDTFVWAGVCLGGIGLLKYKVFGLWGAALASVALLFESVACVVAGHHTFGLWWIGQLACELTFAGAVLVALRVNACQSPPVS